MHPAMRTGLRPTASEIQAGIIMKPTLKMLAKVATSIALAWSTLTNDSR